MSTTTDSEPSGRLSAGFMPSRFRVRVLHGQPAGRKKQQIFSAGGRLPTNQESEESPRSARRRSNVISQSLPCSRYLKTIRCPVCNLPRLGLFVLERTSHWPRTE